MVEEDQDDAFVQVCLENCWWWHAVHPYCSALVISAIFLTSFLVEESYQMVPVDVCEWQQPTGRFTITSQSVCVTRAFFKRSGRTLAAALPRWQHRMLWVVNDRKKKSKSKKRESSSDESEAEEQVVWMEKKSKFVCSRLQHFTFLWIIWHWKLSKASLYTVFQQTKHLGFWSQFVQTSLIKKKFDYCFWPFDTVVWASGKASIV